MIYTIYNCPLNTDVYLTGFRFDKTKVGINVKPVLGKLEGRFYSDKFRVNNSKTTYSVNIYGAEKWYFFSNTLNEAKMLYNSMVNECWLNFQSLADKVETYFIKE